MQRFVIFVARRDRLPGQRHDDDALEFNAVILELFVERQQHVVDDQEAVARVVGDVARCRRDAAAG